MVRLLVVLVDLTLFFENIEASIYKDFDYTSLMIDHLRTD